MSRNIYIESFGGNVYGALTENEKLLEYHIESKRTKKLVGNIYKGKVENILNGMQAAFVDIGETRNGYLYVGDMLVDKNDLDGKIDIPTTLNLNLGDEIMVQAIKDPIGNKGARLTRIISIAGRYLVYLPFLDFVGVSRKITNEEKREKLIKTIDKLRDKESGFIVRTAGEKATKKDLKQEALYLKSLFKKAEETFENSSARSVVYEDGDLPVRMIRDVYSSEIDKIYVDSQEIYDKLYEEIKLIGDEKRNVLCLYEEPEDMFQRFGIMSQIDKLLSNKVYLESGAYLVIDKTEALTVIDVNTGRYTGENCLEETVFHTNLLAAEEIARQVRLRNISGIVIVDFIDMDEEEHRVKIVELLTEELKKDRVKCNVIGMSALGLVEFTRKKTTKDNACIMLKKCPYCEGEGNIYSNDIIVMKIRSSIMNYLSQGYKNVVVDINYNIANYILTYGLLSYEVKEKWKGARVYLIPHKTMHEENFKTRGDNSYALEIPENAKILY